MVEALTSLAQYRAAAALQSALASAEEQRQKADLLAVNLTNERAWEVGLACGGKIQVFVERVE